MRTIVAAAACVAALALVVGAASGGIGANDDTGKFAPDSGEVFFSQMAARGLQQSVMTVASHPSEPTKVPDGAKLDAAIPVAEAAGLRVVLAVFPYPPRELAAGRATPKSFADWLTLVAQRYPTVKQFVVLNEPNQPAFLRPQFGPNGRNVSAARAGAYLAAAYDALKAVDPDIPVIGLGLSPRGNDRPTAPSNVSTSPVRFLTALGAWYRASGRQRPLMDGLSFHPYPNLATDPLDPGLRVAQRRLADLGRIKQAVWDAFRDTAQPTTVNGLKLYLDEVGWQVDTSSSGLLGGGKRQGHERAHAGAIYNALVGRSLRPPGRRTELLRLLRRQSTGTPGSRRRSTASTGHHAHRPEPSERDRRARQPGAPLCGRGIPPSA